MAYGDLEIQEGTAASLQFYRMTFEAMEDVERARIRTALLKYCDATPARWSNYAGRSA